jgi:colanic acid/amylovoran biosynthesis protein
LLWDSDSHLSKDKYRTVTRDLIEKLLVAGRSVTLLAHVIDNPSIDNDLNAIEKLVAEFDDRISVFVPKDLEEVRRFIAGSNVVIGARMHACLNALSLGVPAISLAYSRKFAPLLADIGWPYTLDLRTDSEIADVAMAILQDKTLKARAVQVRKLAEERLQEAVNSLAVRVDASP